MSKIAYCGLDCEKCPAYIVTQENNPEKVNELAKQWSEEYKSVITPKDILCDGCTAGTGRVNGHWYECEIRQCGQDKAVEHCAQCSGFACEKLITFLEQVPEAKENLTKLRKPK